MRLALVAALIWGVAMPVTAQSGPVVVELFTSQGCNSCPPADKLFGMLTERNDVIALSYHVDYWDYLGWKDELGSPLNTKRQRAYARALGERTIYTPQMIVQGEASIVGTHERELERQIRASLGGAEVVNLSADRDADSVVVSLSAVGAGSGASVVYCVEYSPLETVDIERGENAGKRIDYANVVTAMRKMGDWDGRSNVTFKADLVGGMPVVVIVQRANAGPILAAAKVR